MSFRRPLARPVAAVLAAVALAAGLVACGGGTSQYEPFVPDRVIAFGDENSALTAEGRKWSINGTTQVTENGQTVTRFDCEVAPNWTQSLASAYGFVFSQCNPRNETVRAFNRAAPGAGVAEVQAQIDAQIAAGGFSERDLVSVLAGANDIVALYRQFPNRSANDLAAEAGARGRALALQVNRVVSLGAKVILVNAPDMGLTPFAQKENAANGGGNERSVLLTRLSTVFNEQLGVNIVLDGRFIGLVQGDLRLQAMVRVPSAFGLVNVTEGACLATAQPPACDSTTLVTGADLGSHLWSDDLRMGFVAQSQIAALAIDRARRNPF